jgi:choline-sulfatase
MKKLHKPNILILLTDEQTAVEYWDPAWAAENFPAMNRLKKNGLTFTRGTINSCTCSPSRVSLFTGLYPSQHGVTQMLQFDDPYDDNGNATKQQMQVTMQSSLQNMAKMMRSAGYKVVFKGKWHLTKPGNFIVDPEKDIDQLYWTGEDVLHISEDWGFSQWNAPDAGDNMDIRNFGGGTFNNDGRFIDGNGKAGLYGEQPKEQLYKESALAFIENYTGDQPFCLIVSLVNPHDVLSYPGTNLQRRQAGDPPIYEEGGYRLQDFDQIPVTLPVTVNEDLSTKPPVQKEWRDFCNVTNGSLAHEEAQRHYIQFYAYLCSMADKELNKVLEAMDRKNLTDNTLVIRLSDHGDMAVAHGYQRQKMYNVYKESLLVPFIFSNPQLYKEAATTESLASLIDIMPTLATIAGITGPEREQWVFKGRDLTPILADPTAEVQDYTHYMYGDWYFYVPGAGHIRAIVEKDWKYAVYFDPNQGAATEYELYNIAPGKDPEEQRNLAYPAYATPESDAEWIRLHEKLTRVMEELGTTPDAIIWANTWPKVGETAE